MLTDNIFWEFVPADRPKRHAVKYFWSVIQENQRVLFCVLAMRFFEKNCDSERFITKCFGTKMRYTLFANVFRRVLCNREIIRDIQSLQIRHYCLEPWPWIINAIVLTYNLNLDQHNENWQNIRQKKSWKGQLRDHLVAAITSTELYNVPFMQNFANYCVHSFAKQI